MNEDTISLTPHFEPPVGVVLDFDGVVLDSVPTKTKAFRELFGDWRDSVDEIVEYHLRNGGMSRHRKFEYIFTTILGETLTPEIAYQLNQRFRELIWHSVVACPIIEGTVKFIAHARRRGVPVFVASGTEQQELSDVIRARNMTSWFDGAYGSPTRKPQIIDDIAQSNGWSPSSMLFIGDSVTDLDDARAVGIPFLGLNVNGGSSNFPAKTPLVVTLADLKPHDAWMMGAAADGTVEEV